MDETDRDSQNRFQQASIMTANNLKTVATTIMAEDLSRLSYSELEETADLVARIVPAGNVPGVILNGLARMAGRRRKPKEVRNDVKVLFQGVDQVLDKAVYGAFFAGPAAVIWGYQNLLKLAGKNPEDSFPEGTWQFYVDYALREDTARHINETRGFDSILNEHDIVLDLVDRMTAWTMAAAHTLYQYDDLLENEWRERVYTHTLQQIVAEKENNDRFARLYRKWELRRPYARDVDANDDETYPIYRRRKFDDFIKETLGEVDSKTHLEWRKRVHVAHEHDLPDYKKQMSIWGYLQPDSHGELRKALPLHKLRVGVIFQGRYYLLSISKRHTKKEISVEDVREQIATLVANPTGKPSMSLMSLARTRRSAFASLRSKIDDKDTVKGFDALHFTPIILNFEGCSQKLPLSQIRQTERGVGDHALTLIDTGESMVFDQSHIFFDGAWGSALSEIMTNEALSWAAYLSHLPAAEAGDKRPYSPSFRFTDSELESIQDAPKVRWEAGAETDIVKLKTMLSLRKMFKQYDDLSLLTINDLLVLYRAIHSMTYRPSTDLLAQLEDLAESHDRAVSQAAKSALDTFDNATSANPSILIPVDASQRSPRDRLHPMSFQVPLAELDLLNLHDKVINAIDAYKNDSGDRSGSYAVFDKLQRQYLATLAAFGLVLSRAKEIAIAGESASSGTIKLVAHMPKSLQRLLDAIPSKFEVLNDIIKGREVFSNVGAVVPDSTLSRFTTAKDDNKQKTLAWGVITDADHIMHVSLRDFRPHVALLIDAGHGELAQSITQHYLDSYAYNLNGYINDLLRIIIARRETRVGKLGDDFDE